MGSIIRFIFGTNFKYSLFDRICVLMCLCGIWVWFYILFKLLHK